MPKQPEAKFKERLTKAFRKAFPDKKTAGYTYVGVGGPGQKSGYPDLHFHFVSPRESYDGVLHRADHIWVEAKVYPHTLEPHQARTIAALRNAGASVVVATYNPTTKLIRAEWSATERADFPSAAEFWAHV
jgi:hypothetical protein